jgi:hypothetical protein
MSRRCSASSASPAVAHTELEVMSYGERPPAALPDARELTVGPGPERIEIE